MGSPMNITLSLVDWSKPEWWSAVAAVLTFAAAAIYTIFTLVQVRETRKLRRAQTEPCVIVYLEHMSDAPSCLELVVENVGFGVATNIKFTANKPIPHTAYGIEKAQPQEPMKAGPFVSGIPALAPGKSRRHMWGQFSGIKSVTSPDPLVITASFSDLSGRSMTPTSNTIELESFENMVYTTGFAEKIAKHLETISKKIS